MRLGVGVVVVLVVAGALAGAGGARRAWDGCWPRAGDIRFRAPVLRTTWTAAARSEAYRLLGPLRFCERPWFRKSNASTR